MSPLYEDTGCPHSSAPSARENLRSGKSASLDVGKIFAHLSGVEVFSLEEIAAVAGVPVGHVESRVVAGEVPAADQWVSESEAIRLIREIVACRPGWSGSPSFFAVLKARQQRPLRALLTSAGLHALAVAVVGPLHFSAFRMSNPTSRLHRSSLCIRGAWPRRRRGRRRPEDSAAHATGRAQGTGDQESFESGSGGATASAAGAEPEPPPTPPPPAVVTAPVVPKPADPVEAKGVPAPVPKPPAAIRDPEAAEAPEQVRAGRGRGHRARNR